MREALQLVSYLDDITEKDGVLYKTVRNNDGYPKQLLVVPSAMRSEVLKAAHNDFGHQGQNEQGKLCGDSAGGQECMLN